MRRFVPVLLFGALASPAGAAVPVPDKAATATGGGGAAATVDPYATQAAIDVLRDGGNAIDAAVAAAGVLGVVEPYSSGIGGGGFMVIRTADGTLDSFDGREWAPRAWTKRTLLEPGTKTPRDFDKTVTSGLGVGVPGTPGTWSAAVDRYGSRSLGQLLRPGIRLARRGFVVDKTLHEQTVANRARFKRFKATRRLYLPGGKPIATGSTLRNRALARTMVRLSDRGVRRGFYTGPVARDIVRTVRHPQAKVPRGLMSANDLRAYHNLRREPLTTDWRGYAVVGMPPPSSGGTTVLEALNILEAFGEPATDPVEELHRYLEASRLAYADRGRYLGDPFFRQVPTNCLTSQDFADARQALIGTQALKSPVKPGGCANVTPAGRTSTSHEGPNTTHLTVADAYGNVVSYTFTIEQTGGSGMVVPGRGFLLNNELTDFDFEPGTANQPGPHKRPRSSMAPTIVLRDGSPVLALGSPGGSTIITTVLQTLVNRYERGLSLPEAITEPRVTEQNGPKSVAEPGFLSGPFAAGLEGRGHRFEKLTDDHGEIGAVTAIEFGPDGAQRAAAEPTRRGGGSAMVVGPASRRGG